MAGISSATVPFKNISCPSLTTRPDIAQHGFLRRQLKLNKLTDTVTKFINWPNSYVVLHNGCMYIFETEMSEKPVKATSLCGFTHIFPSAPRESAASSCNVRWTFQVVSELDLKENTFKFSAPTRIEMEKWISAFQQEMDFANSQISRPTESRSVNQQQQQHRLHQRQQSPPPQYPQYPHYSQYRPRTLSTPSVATSQQSHRPIVERSPSTGSCGSTCYCSTAGCGGTGQGGPHRGGPSQQYRSPSVDNGSILSERSHESSDSDDFVTFDMPPSRGAVGANSNWNALTDDFKNTHQSRLNSSTSSNSSSSATVNSATGNGRAAVGGSRGRPLHGVNDVRSRSAGAARKQSRTINVENSDGYYSVETLMEHIEESHSDEEAADALYKLSAVYDTQTQQNKAPATKVPSQISRTDSLQSDNASTYVIADRPQAASKPQTKPKPVTQKKSLISVDDALWSGDNISAERMMKSLQVEGVFMIRNSTKPGNQTILIRIDQEIQKYRISTINEKLCLEATGPYFDSLLSLLRFYSFNTLPLRTVSLGQPYTALTSETS